MEHVILEQDDFSCEGTGSNLVELPKGLLIASSEKVALRACIYIQVADNWVMYFVVKEPTLALMHLTEPSSKSSSALEN